MYTSITYTWTPPTPNQLAELFDIGAQELNHMRRPLQFAREMVIEEITQNFVNQDWVPWAESYVARAMQRNSGILWRTGALFDSATSRGSFIITERTLAFNFGAIPDYGPWNQFGASRVAKGEEVDQEALLRNLFSQGLRGETLKTAFQARMETVAEKGGMQNDLPARPFVTVSPATQAAIEEGFDQWLGGIVDFIAHSSGSGMIMAQTRDPFGQFGPGVSLASFLG